MVARVVSSIRASSSRADRATTTGKSLSFEDGSGDDGSDDDASVSLSDADALMVTASSAPTMSRAVHGAALLAASTARCDLVRTRTPTPTPTPTPTRTRTRTRTIRERRVKD